MKNMDQPRRFFIGDVHACKEELQELIEQFAPKKTDQIYSVGDLINKGPDSLGVLKLVQKFQIKAVIGNHERHFLRIVKKKKEQRNEREQCWLDSFGVDLNGWIQVIASWPYYRDLGDILVVHAGLEPGISSLKKMSKRILTTIRTWDGKGKDLDNLTDPPWFECIKTDKTVVFGHWAVRGLVDLPSFKGLDTGCLYGKELTGWCPEEDRFYHIKAKKVYVNPFST